MLNVTRLPKAAAVRLGWIALLLCCWLHASYGADSANPTVTIMTRNMDSGTDLGYIFGATDQSSYISGMAATLAEIQASNLHQRAALLAGEIAATMPDLIALQEVTLWRTGPYGQPPATAILYDQLDMLLAELGKRNLHYGVIAVQAELDAEAPAPNPGIDLRTTDRDVILANLDQPQSQFDLVDAQTHRYKAVFNFGNAMLGQIPVPCGWLAVDATVNGSQFRFVNTHLQSTVAGAPEAQQVQVAQGNELLLNLAFAGMPVVLAGDFNSNAEFGPERAGVAQKIVAAGYTDTWKSVHPADPGYTWPLFGQDQKSGPAAPDERIDLIFTGSLLPLWTGHAPVAVSAVRTGMTPPYASDHAGLVVKLQLQ
jgi:endonuclease/exonuclease/phosphatase family metal-dependent hydrolase